MRYHVEYAAHVEAHEDITEIGLAVVSLNNFDQCSNRHLRDERAHIFVLEIVEVLIFIELDSWNDDAGDRHEYGQ